MEMQMEINAAEMDFEARLSALEESVAGIAARLEEMAAQQMSDAAAQQVSAAAGHVTEKVTSARKTLPVQMTSLLAKQGVSLDASQGTMQAGALDEALASLSIEQRLAVKAQLLRAGMLQ